MRLARPGLAPSVETAMVSCPRRRIEGTIKVQSAGTSTTLSNCPFRRASFQMAALGHGQQVGAELRAEDGDLGAGEPQGCRFLRRHGIAAHDQGGPAAYVEHDGKVVGQFYLALQRGLRRAILEPTSTAAATSSTRRPITHVVYRIYAGLCKEQCAREAAPSTVH